MARYIQTEVSTCRLETIQAVVADSLEEAREKFNAGGGTFVKEIVGDIITTISSEVTDHDERGPLDVEVQKALYFDGQLKLKLPASSIYTEVIPEFGDVMSVADFTESAEDGNLMDSDGHGCPARDGKMARRVIVHPSVRAGIPDDATHIVWFNK